MSVSVLDLNATVASRGARVGLRAGVGAFLFWASLASAQTQPTQIFVKPGDVVSIPLPVENAGDSGADINNVKVVVSGNSAFVTNPTDSATNSVPVGQTVTFTSSFTVGNVTDGTYTVSLKVVTADILDPDASDPAQDISVTFKIDPVPLLGVLDSNGMQIAANSYIRTPYVVANANDTAGAGLYDVIIDPPGFVQEDFLGGAATDKVTYPHAAGNMSLYSGTPLPDGKYAVAAVDVLGQATTVYFTVVNTPPKISVLRVIPDPNNPGKTVQVPIAPDGISPDRDICIDVADAAFSSATVTLTGYDPVIIDTATECASYKGLDIGHYDVTAYDPIGNTSQKAFEIRSAGPRISMFDITGAVGNIPNVPQVLSKINAFTVTSDADLVSIGASGVLNTSIPQPFPPGTHNVTGSVSGGNGSFNLTATDALKQSSSLNWQVGDLIAMTTMSANTYTWNGFNKLSADLTITANASFGVNDVATYPTSNTSDIVHVPDPSHLGTPDFTLQFSTAQAAVVVSTSGRIYFYTDKAGNNATEASFLQTVELGTGAYITTAPAGYSYDQTSPSVDIEASIATTTIFSSIGAPLIPLAGPRVAVFFDTMTSVFAAPVQIPKLFVSSVPITNLQHVGHLTVTETGSGTKLIDQDVDVSSPAGMTSLNLLKKRFQVQGGVAFEFKLDGAPPKSVLRSNCVLVSTSDSNMCDRGVPLTLIAGVSPNFAYMAGVFGGGGEGITPGQVLAGTKGINAGAGVFLSNLHVNQASGFSASLIGLQIPGWIDAGGPYAFSVGGSLDAFSRGLTVTLPPPSAPAKQSNGAIQVLWHALNDPADPNMCKPFVPIATASPGQSISLFANTPGIYKYAVDEFASRAVATLGDLTFTSNGPPVQLQDVTSDPRYAQALNVMGASGQSLVGLAFEAAPTGRKFAPDGLAQIQLGQNDLAGIVANGLQLVQFSLDGGSRGVHDVQYNPVCMQATGRVDQLSSVFGVFAPTAAATVPRDLLPPITTLLVDGNAVSTRSGLTITSTSTLALTAADPVFPGAPTSGVKNTFLGVNTVFIDTAITSGQVVSGTFSVTVGTYTAFFYSVDNAGNVERVHLSTIVVNPPPARAVAGLGLGLDNTNRLWSIALDSGSVALAHNNAAGVLIASATLPNADPSFPWSVLFDQAGNSYAVGVAAGVAANGSDQLAVYKASPAGNAIVASRFFDSGFNNNNLVFGVAAPGWIAGGVQTAGPPGGAGPRAYAAALWKFDPTQGLIQLTATYTRAGQDLATGVTTDAAGHVWLAGFSYSPNPRSPRALDLAVWEYAADGRTLLAGPFLREGYLGDFNTADTARILVSSGVVYVTAPRGRGAGGTDTALVAFDAGTGRVLAENAWRSADGAPTYPAALLQDSVGNLLAAGSFDYGGTVAGLWRYRSDGAFILANQTDAGGAQGAVFNGANLWLIVDGSTRPFLDSVETAAAGALSDVQPPRTSLTYASPAYIGSRLYVNNATPLGLSVVDDKFRAGDGLGTGTTTYYAVDGSSFSLFTSSFQLAAEGVHSVSYYSLDFEGNAEVIRSTSVAVDLTAPVATFSAASSTTFSITAVDPLVNGVASGVGVIRYLVDVPPNNCNGGQVSTAPAGTCANPYYAGPFALAVGTHTVYFQAVDNVGNGANVVGSSYVVVSAGSSGLTSDIQPPRTTLNVGAPSFASSPTYVSPATPLGFTSVDDKLVVGDGVGAGVARTLYAVDSASFTVYSGSFTVAAEGAHVLRFYSVDAAGNTEAVRVSTLAVDATPPATAFKTSGAYFTVNAPEGTRLYAPLAFAYSLPAADPVVNNVASGLAWTRYRTGQLTNYASGAPNYAPGAFANYASTFSLAEGIRRVDFQSQDNVTNLELLKSATVFVDATPPATALTIGAPQYRAGGMLYVSTVTPFSLASQDPIMAEVASGVSGVFFHLDADPFAAYSTTFTIPVPDGVRAAAFYAADNVGNLETVKTSTVALDAAAPQTSLLVVGGHQFPGPDGRTFYASADTRFALPAIDPLVNGVASGLAWTRWQDNGGAFTAYLSTLAVAEGAHALSYQSQDNVANLEVLRSTNIWVDAAPPVTTVAIGSPTYTAADGTIYVTPATPITFAASDPNLPTGQAGSGVNRIEVSLDGGAYAPYTTALKLPEGRHAILYRAVDNVANVEAFHALAVQSDATPPVSSLVIGQPQYQLPGVLLVNSRTPFAVAAVDPVANNVASGVKDVWYNWADQAASTSAFSQFTASFTLSGLDVNKVVSFYSRDNVLNTEVVNSSAVLLDSTPPEVALLSPAACDLGICRVLKGRFPVLGTAKDPHFASYVLDFAPGQNATTGYALISSGTVAVSSGALGTWDASSLIGWQTLRLTATDLVANVSVLAINVYVGDPATLMLLGNHDVFDMPTGVAAGADGNIYVADRDNDRIAVFSSTGGLAAVFGGRHDDHQDDDKVSTTTLRLHEPAGVTVDAGGAVYVADTDHHRVLKLSAAGQILLDLGRRKTEKDDGRVKAEFASGKNPGEFRHPLGVAVDATGSIYVADTGNSRVQVFTSTGGFALQFALPALPAAPFGDDDHDRDARDRDGDDAPALGRPAGIAVDAAGLIYVADLTGRRALRYDPAGNLTLTIPISGDKPGQSGRPFGVAVSTSGDCLLVSDTQFAHILKFDKNGAQNMSFGARARGDDDHDKPKPAGIALRKPAGLALDAAGNLYVADRNAEKIEKFGLPTGQPTLVVPPPGPGDDDTARDVVSREDGGKVERRDKAAVSIPAQAVSDDLKVSVSTPTADVAAAGAKTATDANLKTASPPVDFGPEGTKFSTPVTLTLPYSADLVAQQSGDEASLKVHYWNKDKGQWEELATQVDEQDHTVKAKTTHFSLYQVFATSSSAVKPLAAADPTFTFHAGYAFPNPAHAGGVTIRIQPGLADSVSVRVYDVSGRKVHQSSDFSLNPALDDGNGSGSQYTYDHVWDISGVGSGVYTYVITAKHAGNSDIHKTGKLGVSK